MKENFPQKYITEITGKHKNCLENTPRYARFMIHESISEWTSILGPDVLLLTHREATAKITKTFLSYNEKQGQQLLAEEKFQLFLASQIHDWGEIMVENQGIGDITFDGKNNIMEAAEATIFNKIISSVGEESIKEKFSVVYWDIVMNRDTKLGEIFNAIERIGYLQTAIRAFVGREDGKKIENWRGLAGNVLSNQMQEVLKYSKKYPYVFYFLVKEKASIEKIFEDVGDIEVSLDNAGVQSYSYERLQQAYGCWKASEFSDFKEVVDAFSLKKG